MASRAGGYEAPLHSGLMKALAALLLFVPVVAAAQWWRADMETGGDGFTLALTITAARAIYSSRQEFKRSRAAGWKYAAGWLALGIGMIFFQPLRIIMAVVALAFIWIAFWHGFMRR